MERRIRHRGLLKVAVLAAGLVALLLIARALPVLEWAAAFTETLRAQGLAGAVGFGVAFALLSSAFVPGSILSMIAGATWGLWIGTLIVVPAAAVATMGSAWLGRTMLREATEGLLARQRLLSALDRAFGKRAFRMVALLRLSPIMPFAASNYALGATSAPILSLGLGTLVGLVPITLVWVHLGTLAGETVLQGATPEGNVKLALLAGGLAATIAVLAWLGRLARQELEREGGGPS